MAGAASISTETLKSSQPEPSSSSSQPPRSSPNPTTTTITTITNKDDVLSRPDTDFVSIPSYSRWFSWDNIHQCELRFLPEFFDGRSPSKNPKVYKYYRNAIIHRFRDNPSKKITFTEVRKTIIGDVGSIRRVFDFLEAWGLINYSPSKSTVLQLKSDDSNSKSTTTTTLTPPPPPELPPSAVSDTTNSSLPKKRLCGDCKCVCSFSCFTSDKRDLTLCARCYVHQNRLGINTSDFRRVEITEVVKNNWTDKETLLLLEAVMHYGDDWKKVAERVTGKCDKDCVARFIKLPFGGQFVGTPELSEMDHELGSKDSSFPNKRMRLTPLADASNPIMAQAAFLSALVGVEVAEVAAHAAVTALSDCSVAKTKENLKSISGGAKKQDSDVASNGDTANRMDGAFVEAQLQLEKEEEDLERELSGIAIQTKELEDKIVHFEELDLQLEKGCQQLQQLKDLLFVDKLSLLFHKAATAQKTGDSIAENVKVE